MRPPANSEAIWLSHRHPTDYVCSFLSSNSYRHSNMSCDALLAPAMYSTMSHKAEIMNLPLLNRIPTLAFDKCASVDLAALLKPNLQAACATRSLSSRF